MDNQQSQPQQETTKLTKNQSYMLYGTVGALAGAMAGALAGVLIYDKDLRKKFQEGYENLRDMSYKMLDDVQEMREKRQNQTKLLANK